MTLDSQNLIVIQMYEQNEHITKKNILSCNVILDMCWEKTFKKRRNSAQDNSSIAYGFDF